MHHLDENDQILDRLFPVEKTTIDQYVPPVAVAAISSGDVLVPSAIHIVVVTNPLSHLVLGNMALFHDKFHADILRHVDKQVQHDISVSQEKIRSRYMMTQDYYFNILTSYRSVLLAEISGNCSRILSTYPRSRSVTVICSFSFVSQTMFPHGDTIIE